MRGVGGERRYQPGAARAMGRVKESDFSASPSHPAPYQAAAFRIAKAQPEIVQSSCAVAEGVTPCLADHPTDKKQIGDAQRTR
jgi:hypothetical protein